MDDTEALNAIKTLLQVIGENPYREQLLKTPQRVLASFRELCSGYAQNPAQILDECCDALPDYNGPVELRDIPFASLCEHHLLPFTGFVHISYIPDGKVYGISRIAKLVDMFARRLQIQERMTQEIAETMFQHIQPRTITVTVEAEHMCLSMRGIQKPGTILKTEITLTA